MKYTYKLALLAAFAIAPLTSARAVVIFSDDFESGLGQWTVNQAVTVYDGPTHGMVMTFTGKASGGDTWTTLPVITGAPGLYLSFDYKGGGGYLGVGPHSNNWLAGEAGYGSSVPFIALDYSGSWNHYEIALPAGVAGQLMVEDFVGSQFRGATFDNFRISDAPGSHATPDAGTTGLMFGSVLLTLGAIRRKLA